MLPLALARGRGGRARHAASALPGFVFSQSGTPGSSGCCNSPACSRPARPPRLASGSLAAGAARPPARDRCRARRRRRTSNSGKPALIVALSNCLSAVPKGKPGRSATADGQARLTRRIVGRIMAQGGRQLHEENVGRGGQARHVGKHHGSRCDVPRDRMNLNAESGEPVIGEAGAHQDVDALPLAIARRDARPQSPQPVVESSLPGRVCVDQDWRLTSSAAAVRDSRRR